MKYEICEKGSGKKKHKQTYRHIVGKMQKVTN